MLGIGCQLCGLGNDRSHIVLTSAFQPTHGRACDFHAAKDPAHALVGHILVQIHHGICAVVLGKLATAAGAIVNVRGHNLFGHQANQHGLYHASDDIRVDAVIRIVDQPLLVLFRGASLIGGLQACHAAVANQRADSLNARVCVGIHLAAVRHD